MWLTRRKAANVGRNAALVLWLILPLTSPWTIDVVPHMLADGAWGYVLYLFTFTLTFFGLLFTWTGAP